MSLITTTNNQKLTSEWWKWFIEDERNKIQGTERKMQYGPHFFISSQWALGKRLLETDNTIEEGKTIVVPVINWLSVSKGKDWITKKLMLRKARHEIKDTIATHRSDVPSMYIESPFFQVHLYEGNQFRVVEGDYNAVSCGYWTIVELPRGKHVLTSFGSCRNGTLTMDQKHRVEVV
jgi:hypothetical protein